jgi:AcrR family transcriptional regulator
MPKPSKRDQLVEATKELLWEVGYKAMSPRDIQARSAAKPGSLYHHFPSKLAIAEWRWARLRRRRSHVLKRLAGVTVITEEIAGRTRAWRRLFHSPG